MSAKHEQTHELDRLIELLIENDPDHYHLKMAGVTVAVLYFRSDGPLKLHGYPAAAVVKKVSTKDRALGMKDSVITVDWNTWSEMQPRQRVALVDHELMHLKPVIEEWEYARDGEGEIIYEAGEPVKKSATYEFDDLHRPKLTMRLHDVEHGWFLRCAEKWGRDAGETQQAVTLYDRHGQLLFGLTATANEIAFTERREEARAKDLPPDVLDYDRDWLEAQLLDAAHDLNFVGVSEEDAEAPAQRFKERMAEAAGPGGSVTITAGGESVTIKGRGKKDAAEGSGEAKFTVVTDGKRKKMSADQLLDAVKKAGEKDA